MRFTDQKRRVATEDDLGRSWGGEPKGTRFRCYLCGYKFKAGDGWRWVYSDCRKAQLDGKTWGLTNLLTCDACDGKDVIDRWAKLHEEFYQPRFWALR